MKCDKSNSGKDLHLSFLITYNQFLMTICKTGLCAVQQNVKILLAGSVPQVFVFFPKDHLKAKYSQEYSSFV